MHAFLYISSPSLHDYDVKIPIFTFVENVKAGQRLFFFSWTSIQSFRILQKEMPTFDELSEMESYKRDKVWSSAVLLFKWLFRFAAVAVAVCIKEKTEKQFLNWEIWWSWSHLNNWSLPLGAYFLKMKESKNKCSLYLRYILGVPGPYNKLCVVGVT